MVSHLIGTAAMSLLHPVLASTSAEIAKEGLRSLALGIGAGGGAAGAGIGIGMLFGKVIESVARQPEMRDEITGLQWLGFALTEATFFYGLVGGFIAFFL